MGEGGGERGFPTALGRIDARACYTRGATGLGDGADGGKGGDVWGGRYELELRHGRLKI